MKQREDLLWHSFAIIDQCSIHVMKRGEAGQWTCIKAGWAVHWNLMSYINKVIFMVSFIQLPFQTSSGVLTYSTVDWRAIMKLALLIHRGTVTHGYNSMKWGLTVLSSTKLFHKMSLCWPKGLGLLELSTGKWTSDADSSLAHFHWQKELCCSNGFPLQIKRAVRRQGQRWTTGVLTASQLHFCFLKTTMEI